MTPNRAIFRELKRQGRSQRWLAEQLGVHESVVSRWKRGLEMSPEQVTLACSLLSLVLVSPDGEPFPRVTALEPARAA